MTIRTLQQLGLYHGSLISISNGGKPANTSFSAQVCSLREGDLDSENSMPEQRGCSMPSGHLPASNPWQHNAAYLSPMLAFHLGFQPQLMPFLDPSPDQQPSHDTTQPRTSPSPSGVHQAHLLSALSPDDPSRQLMPVHEFHGRQHIDNSAAVISSSREHASHPIIEGAGQPVQGTSRELCREGYPSWRWVDGQVCLQPPQTPAADSAPPEHPQRTVSVSQPGDLL